jgi:putative peptidoglycan lipid II flippase
MAKSSIVKNISIVSSMTALSRVLGFLRDMTLFSFFGLAEIGDAFLLAFSFPNLFRRLLGEGALSSALVPILSSQYVEHGKDAMFDLFSHVILRLFIILCGGLVLTCVIVLAVNGIISDPRWNMALTFTAMLLPYMVFVCLAAVGSAALNVMGRFFVSSINQVWMNLSMIFSLLLGGHVLGFSEHRLVNCLIVGVLIGGLIQLIVPLSAMVSLGWRPKFRGSVPNLNTNMMAIWKLFLPGAFGAAIEQLNFLIARTIAYGCGASAVSVLYLAVRITELPTGIFGLAIVSVFFPQMAKIASSQNNAREMGKTFNACLVALVWILLPSAIGLFVLRHEILSFFFQHGHFDSNATLAVAKIIAIYCISMTFSGLASLLVRGFHSLKDTKTPVYIGGSILIVNAILALMFMRIFGVAGLAATTAFTTVLQAVCLFGLFKKRVPTLMPSTESKSFMTIFFGSVMVAGVATGTKLLMTQFCIFDRRINDLLLIISTVTTSLLAYLFMSRKLIAKAFQRKEAK